MKPEPNNDIDLLLRQLSRRNGAPVSAPAREIDEQHLDADELNSYVANALPAAARARYTAHLADCSSCRKLVVDLSAAQGPIPAQQDATVAAPSGLKSFLASLFSPMVLRYAVPALGLIVVALVGFVVLRQERTGRSVAQLNNAEQKTVVPASPPAGESTEPRPYYDSDSLAKNEERQRQPAAAAAKEDQSGKVAPVTRAAPAVVANQPVDATGTAASAEPPPPAAPKAVPAEDEPTRGAEREKKNAEGAKPQTSTATADSSKDGLAKSRTEDANKNEAQKTETSVNVAGGVAARRDIVVRPAKGPETGAQDYKRAPAPTQEKMRSQARSEEKEADEAGETRSVAGRRFRKSGRVWIDTAYDSSKAITTVARGSEQYRALVADEPSIRKIADELDGEIVVVWKGSTYRIR
jgi:hypothetical protein